MLYKQAAEVVMTMLKQHLTIGQMDSVGEYMMEHYLRDLLGYYLETMIHENGNYLMGYNRLKNEFHHEDAGQSFHMIKKEDCEIPPEIFRKILFLLMILTKACRQILGKYAVSVTMETASEKFFVVRFSCDYSQNLDKNDHLHRRESGMSQRYYGSDRKNYGQYRISYRFSGKRKQIYLKLRD